MQSEFNFDQPGPGPDGYQSWAEQRQATLKALARKLGLPLGHPVELWLPGGVRLRGVLQFETSHLFVNASRLDQTRLCVDGVSFAHSEIESVVRLD